MCVRVLAGTHVLTGIGLHTNENSGNVAAESSLLHAFTAMICGEHLGGITQHPVGFFVNAV